MTRISKIILLCLTFAGSGGIAGIAGAVDKLDVQQAIAEAKDAFKQADSVGGAWRDTTKMIKKAEKLMNEGQLDKALELAREAEAQGMLGYMQARSQSTIDKLHID